MPRKSRNTSPKHVEHAIVPQVETLIRVQATPHAVCFLSHPMTQGRRMQLDADAQGIVRFHAHAAKHGQSVELDLESSSEDGVTTFHKIAIRSDSRAPAQTRTPNSRGTVRPPLAGDLMALSNRELIKRGYPPRPDPAQSPSRFARWHRRVARPFTLVDAKMAPHPSVSFAQQKSRRRAQARSPQSGPLPVFSPTLPLPPPRAHSALQLSAPTLPLPPPVARSMFNSNSNIWSGALLTNPVGQFCWIEADWRVPGVFALPNAPLYSAAAEWIGLDSGGGDLYQAGTDSECWYSAGCEPFRSSWTVTNYWMWIESLPFAPWGLPNFPVSPGDTVSVDIFLADANGMSWFQNGSNGGLTPADNNVWFMIYNETQGLSYWGTIPTAPQSIGGTSSTGFTGTTAEFILERPSDLSSGQPYPLAAFGIAGMNSCVYGDSEYGDRPWQLVAAGSSPFDCNLSYLNMQNSSSGDLLALALSVPNDPNGYGIAWFWTNYT